MDLVILAGGRGSRIKNFSKGKPKPFIKFNNICFIDYLLNFYCKFDLNNIYILAGYKGNLIYKKFNGQIRNFVKIHCYIENKLLGTGGALKKIKKKLSKNFFLVNGDSIQKVDLNNLVKLKEKNKQILSLYKSEKKIKSDKKFSSLKINKKGLIEIDKNFKKKYKFYNSGIYMFDKKIFNFFPKKKIISLEDDVIYKLILKNKIIGIKNNCQFLDIGTPKDLRKADKVLKKLFYKPAIFFDRDNTINYDKGYTYKIKEFKFKPSILKNIALLQKKFYIFIITNQAGIAHGKFTEENLAQLHKFIKKKVYFRYKAFINDVEYCPYHPNAKIKKFKLNSLYRKPGNLMIERIFKRWPVNRKKSYFIGDSYKDYLASKKSKIRFFNINLGINKINKLILKKTI
jgi:histidinol-phosphate phosphatase family protein